MLNGSRAKKIPREPMWLGVTRAEVPVPPEVPILSCTVWVEVPSIPIVLGENEQVEPEGPTQEKPMLLLNPFTGVIVRVKEAEPPCTTETPLALGVTVKSAFVGLVDVPVPVRVTDCGEFEELPLMVKVAFSVATNVGVNVTAIVQVPPAAMTVFATQVVAEVIAKSARFAPVMVTLLIVSVPLPGTLVTVKVWAKLVVLVC
jgi:hypothetical protein